MNRMMCAAALAVLLGRASAEEPAKRAAYYQTNWTVAGDGRATLNGLPGRTETTVAPVKPVGYGVPMPSVLPPGPAPFPATGGFPAAALGKVRQASAVVLASPVIRADPATLPAALLAGEGRTNGPKVWLQAPLVRPTGDAAPTAVRGPIRATSQDGSSN